MTENVHVLVSTIANNVLEVLFDDDEDFAAMMMAQRATACYTKRVCMQSYVEDVVPLYTLTDFKSHFRLERTTVESLIEVLTPHYIRDHSLGGQPQIPIIKQILPAIWMLVNQEVYRSVADRFDLAKLSLWEYVYKFCDALIALSNEYICWPNHDEIQRNINSFERKTGFPGIVGAGDGMHVPIAAPPYNPVSYINRNKYHSVLLQGIADHNYTFIHTFSGCAGSMHDARVFRVSDINRLIAENPDTYLPFNSHILGDSAYHLSPTMLVPFKDNGHLTRREKHFNYKLSSNRVVIEQTFGLLRGRMRSLKMLNMHRTDLIPKVILACCVLHNICMKANDHIDPDPEPYERMRNNNIGEMQDNVQGVNKREFVADLLMQIQQ